MGTRSMDSEVLTDLLSVKNLIQHGDVRFLNEDEIKSFFLKCRKVEICQEEFRQKGIVLGFDEVTGPYLAPARWNDSEQDFRLLADGLLDKFCRRNKECLLSVAVREYENVNGSDRLKKFLDSKTDAFYLTTSNDVGNLGSLLMNLFLDIAQDSSGMLRVSGIFNDYLSNPSAEAIIDMFATEMSDAILMKHHLTEIKHLMLEKLEKKFSCCPNDSIWLMMVCSPNLKSAVNTFTPLMNLILKMIGSLSESLTFDPVKKTAPRGYLTYKDLVLIMSNLYLNPKTKEHVTLFVFKQFTKMPHLWGSIITACHNPPEVDDSSSDRKSADPIQQLWPSERLAITSRTQQQLREKVWRHNPDTQGHLLKTPVPSVLQIQDPSESVTHELQTGASDRTPQHAPADLGSYLQPHPVETMQPIIVLSEQLTMATIPLKQSLLGAVQDVPGQEVQLPTLCPVASDCPEKDRLEMASSSSVQIASTMARENLEEKTVVVTQCATSFAPIQTESRELTIVSDIFKKEWLLGKPIGQGAFGRVVLASNELHKPVSPDTPFVVKMEPYMSGPLFVERNFYLRSAKLENIQEWLQLKRRETVGIPEMYSFGSCLSNGKRLRFIVLPNLGTDVQTLLSKHGNQLHVKTAFTIAIHVIDVLEFIHWKGYIHADIKGANIVLGVDGRAQAPVYLIDYGLAARFKSRDGALKEYDEDPRLAHVGTMEFSSRDSHHGVVCRRSDLESLGYCMVSWLGGVLPWQEFVSKPDQVMIAKEKAIQDVGNFLSTAFPGLEPPSVLVAYFNYAASLDFSSEPDYDYVKKLLRAGIEGAGFQCDLKVTFDSHAELDREAMKRVAEVESVVPHKKICLDAEATPRTPCLESKEASPNPTYAMKRVMDLKSTPKAQRRKPRKPRASDTRPVPSMAF